MHTHTHIHRHTEIHVNACTHAHAHKNTRVDSHTYMHTCTRTHNAHPLAAAGLRLLASGEALWAHTWDEIKGDWVAPSLQYLQLRASTIHTLGKEGRGWNGGRWRVFLNSTMSCPAALSSTPVLGPHIPEGQRFT